MSENIKVAIRLRKPKSDLNLPFDYVLESGISQTEVFNRIAKNTVEWIFQGYNSTIFAYGPTSSGKTYTMFGEENDNLGIIPRACRMICDYKNPEVVEKTIKLSFLEIYKENLQDLLKDNNFSRRENRDSISSRRDSSNLRESKENSGLRIRQTPNNDIYIQELTEKKVSTYNETAFLIQQGLSHRRVSSTACNNQSSRSHAILTITLTQKFIDNSELIGKLHLIDLAGSENITKSEVTGIALTESTNINKSLLVLGNVINSLTEKRTHIPYRDSKLTYLLKDSLGGNSKTILIATINPEDEKETNNTLKFAKRAKEIKNAPKINKKSSLEELLQKIKELEIENSRYRKGTVEFNKIIYDQNQFETIENFYLDRIDELSDLFDKQRDLTINYRNELLEEKDKSAKSILKISLYRDFISTCKDIIDEDKCDIGKLKNIIKRFNLVD